MSCSIALELYNYIINIFADAPNTLMATTGLGDMILVPDPQENSQEDGQGIILL